MRILHVSSVYPPMIVGGAEKVAESLAEAQVALGHEVGAAYLSRDMQPAGVRNGVAVFPQPNRNLIWMEDVLKAPRPLRTLNKFHAITNRRATRDFAELFRAYRPDIVHTHSMVDLPPMLWSAAHDAGARSVHTLHDYDLICSRASMFRNGHSCQRRHSSCFLVSHWKGLYARHIDGVAAVSTPVLDEHRRFGLFADMPAHRMRVIWNGVPAAETAVVRSPKANTGPFVFGFLGRLVPEKGLSVLLQACAALPGQGWKLRIAGRAPDDDAPFRRQAETLPVEFLGFVDPQAFLDTIDVLVVPSIWREPFGMTVVEAFARGVPVIGSRLGAIQDLVGAVGREWLVPPEDASALARRMTAVLSAGRRMLPAAHAYGPILEQVSVARMVAAYDTLYADIAS